MTKTRVEAFTDGVFAIVITLLVLDIKFPEGKISNNGELLHAIAGTLPNIFTYLFSFLVVGVFWMAHHRLFAFVKQVNHYLLWSNIIYLMTVAIIPYPASILAKHPFFSGSVIFYASVLLLCAVQHLFFLGYLMKHEAYRNGSFSMQQKKRIYTLALAGPVLYVLAIVSSLITPVISFVFLLASLIFYIFFAQLFDGKNEAADRSGLPS